MHVFKQSEYNFLNEISETCRLSMIIGVKGSGKSHLGIAILKYMLANRNNNGYTHFCLVIPNYTRDQHNVEKYSFLKKFENVYVFNTYNLYVLNFVQNLVDPNNKIFFFVDDASSSFQKAFNDREHQFLTDIATESRHLKINLILLAHNLAGTFSPLVRSMFDFIVVFKITNGRLLEYVYDEFVSLHHKFIGNKKLFIRTYVDLVDKKYQAMMIDNIAHDISLDVGAWTILGLVDIPIEDMI